MFGHFRRHAHISCWKSSLLFLFYVSVQSLNLTMSQYTFILSFCIVTEINTRFVNNHYSLSYFLFSTFICNFSVYLYELLHPIIRRGFNFNKDKAIISCREMLIRISVGYVVLCSIYHNYELLPNATKEE